MLETIMKKFGENKDIAKKIQAFSKSNNAIALNLSKKKKIKEYINIKI